MSDSSSTTTLADALAALTDAAQAAGIDAAVARAEGEALAATVARPNKGAFVEWAEQVGEAGGAEAFFDAASRGGRYRAGPTPTMAMLSLERSQHAPTYAKALSDVALAATLLGQPDPQAVGNATMAAAAQLGEASGAPGPTPGAFDLSAREPVPGVGDEMLDQVRRMGDQVRRQLEAMNSEVPRVGESAPLAPMDREGPPPLGAGQDADTSKMPGAEAEDRREAAARAPDISDGSAVAEQSEPVKTVEELLAELDELIGLTNVKAEIHRQAAVLRVEGLRKEAGLDTPTITRHLVFNGNPGTGKTTVARLVAGIYRALGLLSKGQLVEVDRSELVAGYLGQTAMKTAEVVKSAEGGVLFIDEAYALSGDQYGKEAIDTLVKEMEDKRNDLVVIVAGYPLPMAVFISENPGLESRFRTHIEFPDYTDDELVGIFSEMATKADYDAGEPVLEKLRSILADAQRGPSFGNARFVRNLLEAAIGHHAWRLRETEEPTIEQLRTLEPEDLVVTETTVEQLMPPEGAEPIGVVDALDEAPVDGDNGAPPVDVTEGDPTRPVGTTDGQEET